MPRAGVGAGGGPGQSRLRPAAPTQQRTAWGHAWGRSDAAPPPPRPRPAHLSGSPDCRAAPGHEITLGVSSKTPPGCDQAPKGCGWEVPLSLGPRRRSVGAAGSEPEAAGAPPPGTPPPPPPPPGSAPGPPWGGPAREGPQSGFVLRSGIRATGGAVCPQPPRR